MSIINLLDESLTNLIAAGEVVERPFSVVKELVENSIDAKSTFIQINLVESGMKEIEVVDNGIGMDEYDAKMCFMPHATSKISKRADLFRIQTLGFRGEAIASIASVSDMTLRTNDGNTSTLVNYRAGKFIKQEKTSINKGTIFTVKNLFFNTPARLKYLKSPNTELSVIIDFISKIALANPDIRFKLINNQKVLINTYGNSDVIGLIGNIYGLEVAKNVIESKAQGDGFTINSFLVEPYINRTKRDNIVLIVNGRVVKNNEIIYSVIDAYNTLIPVGRYPIAVINIKIDPLLIDVNVHPNKKEIKFSSISEICNVLKNSIRESLDKKVLIPSIKNESKIEKIEFSFVENVDKKEDRVFEKEENYKKQENIDIYLNEAFKVFKENDNKIEKEPQKEQIPYLEYIGMFAGTYLLFQNNEGLYLVDQHAAAERIRYEYYYDHLGKISTTQELLIPFNIELNILDFNYLKENMQLINSYGFILEESGLNSFYVRQIPIYIKDNLEDYTREIFDYIIKYKDVNISKIRDLVAKQISCKGAIKANHNLLANEAINLVNQLRECKVPYTCPHGRPTIIKFTHYEIEKLFKRVM